MRRQASWPIRSQPDRPARYAARLSIQVLRSSLRVHRQRKSLSCFRKGLRQQPTPQMRHGLKLADLRELSTKRRNRLTLRLDFCSGMWTRLTLRARLRRSFRNLPRSFASLSLQSLKLTEELSEEQRSEGYFRREGRLWRRPMPEPGESVRT